MRFQDYIQQTCEGALARDPQDFIGMTVAYKRAAELFDLRESHSLSDASWRAIYTTDLPDFICPVMHGVTWFHFRNEPFIFDEGRGRTTRVNDPKKILRDVQILIANYRQYEPAEFYGKFMDIYPWPRGNEQVASLLYNILNGTIHDPQVM